MSTLDLTNPAYWTINSVASTLNGQAVGTATFAGSFVEGHLSVPDGMCRFYIGLTNPPPGFDVGLVTDLRVRYTTEAEIAFTEGGVDVYASLPDESDTNHEAAFFTGAALGTGFNTSFGDPHAFSGNQIRDDSAPLQALMVVTGSDGSIICKLQGVEVDLAEAGDWIDLTTPALWGITGSNGTVSFPGTGVFAYVTGGVQVIDSELDTYGPESSVSLALVNPAAVLGTVLLGVRVTYRVDTSLSNFLSQRSETYWHVNPDDPTDTWWVRHIVNNDTLLGTVVVDTFYPTDPYAIQMEAFSPILNVTVIGKSGEVDGDPYMLSVTLLKIEVKLGTPPVVPKFFRDLKGVTEA